jgi:hypothetical protein
VQARRVGVYPGTFDPPTIAHVAIAEAAHRQCRLDVLDIVVNARPLGKNAAGSLESRVARLEALTVERPWLRVVVTDQRYLADIAEGYDVLVLGADKWAQVIDESFYASAAERDAAAARLPQLAVVPREDWAVPKECVLLDIEPHLRTVSSTAARAGEVHLVAPEVRPLLGESGPTR